MCAVADGVIGCMLLALLCCRKGVDSHRRGFFEHIRRWIYNLKSVMLCAAREGEIGKIEELAGIGLGMDEVVMPEV